MSRSDEIAELCAEAEEALTEGDAESALELAEQAVELAPRQALPHLLKAEAHYLLDDDAKADEAFDKALSLQPDDAELLVRACAIKLGLLADDPHEVEWALETCQRARALVPENDPEGLAVELARLEGVAYGLRDQLEASHQSFLRAMTLAGDEADLDLRFEYACALFHLSRFEEARQLLVAITREDRRHADGWHWLGLVAEFTGDAASAENHFAKARQLDPDQYPEPVHLDEKEMAEAVEEALARVPPQVRRWLANVPIIIDDVPSVDDLKGPPALSPLSVGMFKGPVGPGVEAARATNDVPPQIHLYQRNLERYLDDPELLRDEIEQTLLHEIGHFVGWDEDELHERGLH